MLRDEHGGVEQRQRSRRRRAITPVRKMPRALTTPASTYQRLRDKRRVGDRRPQEFPGLRNEARCHERGDLAHADAGLGQLVPDRDRQVAAHRAERQDEEQEDDRVRDAERRRSQALRPQVLVEERDRPRPRELGGGFVVARRRVVVEAVIRARVHVHLVLDAVRLERRLVRGPAGVDARRRAPRSG